MGKLYKRVGQPAKKMCDSCKTVWDDKQLFNDQHQYGTTNCPSCHAPWEATEIIKLPPLVMRKTARMEQKIYKLHEQLGELDGQSFQLQSTPIQITAEPGVDRIETEGELRARHARDLNALASLRVERVTIMGKITEMEAKLAEEVTFIPEPEGIRLKSGQMDWDVAYANLRAYRDKKVKGMI